MSIDFDSSLSQRYEINNAILTAFPLTMACWFNADSFTANRTLLGFGSSSGGNQFQVIGASSSGVYASGEVGGVVATATTATAPSTGTWHHAAGVFTDLSNRAAFIDGGSKATNTTTLSSFGGFINRTLIGARRRNGTYALHMEGRIAECAIWDTDLNDDEIYSLSRGVRPSLVRPGNLVLYIPLVREVYDLMATRTINVNSTPTVADHTRRIA
jgi:hypothetical protein